MNELVWIAAAIVVIFILYEPISTILAFLEKNFIKILFASFFIAFFLFAIKDFHKKTQATNKDKIEQEYTVPHP